MSDWSAAADMFESTIITRGRTTVPAAVRILLQTQPGTRLAWAVLPGGIIAVRPAPKSVPDLTQIPEASEGKR